MKLSLGRKEESEVVRMLESVPIFSGLEKKRIKSMAENFKERSYDAGETIETEGDTAISFYLIISGSVDVKKRNRSIAKLGTGQYFGEMALLDKQPRSASIIAREPTRCLLMTSWTFLAFLRTNPDLSIAVMKELARRLRETNQALTE